MELNDSCCLSKKDKFRRNWRMSYYTSTIKRAGEDCGSAELLG